MTCPMTPDWLIGRGKGIGKAPIPSLADDSSLPIHCPAHEIIPYNEGHSGDLGLSCCLSGCCYRKKHSKINDAAGDPKTTFDRQFYINFLKLIYNFEEVINEDKF